MGCCCIIYNIGVTYVGKGMPYLPAAASLAAAHKGKVKNIRATVLRENKDSRKPWCRHPHI